MDAYQHDTDGDTTGDNCDSDSDNDGIPNTTDCAVLDNTLWSSPVEVTNLVFAGNAVALSWSPQVATDGSPVSYDVVKGDLLAMRSGSGDFSAAICHSVRITTPTSTDTSEPLPNGGFFYLVRARTTCRPGNYGTGTSTPRSISACPD